MLGGSEEPSEMSVKGRMSPSLLVVPGHSPREESRPSGGRGWGVGRKRAAKSPLPCPWWAPSLPPSLQRWQQQQQQRFLSEVTVRGSFLPGKPNG